MDKNTELNMYIERWQNRLGGDRKGGFFHTKEAWDERADLWVRGFDRVSGKEASHSRMLAISRHLREKGQLQKDHRVVDIGCGPGYYVAEFAKTAGHATGIDLSSRMLEYAAEHAASLGLDNVSYRAINFPSQADIAHEGWQDAFDLVFTSIPPAFSNLDALEKIHAMSRGYCFNNGWIWRNNSVKNTLMSRIFGKQEEDECTKTNMRDLFNILWLMDCRPELSCYEEESVDDLTITEELVSFHANSIAPQDKVTEELIKAVEKELRSMADNGVLTERVQSVFGWLLWRSPETRG